MKKIIGVISTVVSAGVAVFVGKVVYDLIQDNKKREEFDREFFDDIEDDFEYMSKSAPSKVEDPKPVSEPKPTSIAKATATPKATNTTKATATPKKSSAPKTTSAPKKESTTKPAPKKNNSSDGITCQDVIDCTANVLGVSSEDILSKSRKGDVANARRVAIYICANDLGVSNATICEEFGGIGASSVSNAKKNITEKIKTDDELAADIEDITDEIKQLEKSFKR